MNWFERQVERIRALSPRVADGLAALLFAVIALFTVFFQDVREGLVEPNGLAAVTALLACAPVAVRRRAPLLAISTSCAMVFAHIALDFPEGSLPLTALFLTYSVAAWSPLRRAVTGLVIVYSTLIALVATDAPGLDTGATVGNLAFFGVFWAFGVAVRARRETLDTRVRELEERANVERQRSARVLAEQRLQIAQELHDVVAHSMSVIAVQAGVGAHVLDDRPEQARAALDAISATSRGALSEMRRLLGVLRDHDGERSHQPAPALVDVPQLVDDVRAAGVPVTLDVRGSSDSSVNPAVELSAYRVVQEALTNVIKHAGAPSRVDVVVEHRPGSLVVEVADDGRGAASSAFNGANGVDGSGHGLVGMRERVELWGGQLSVGPAPGGGYRVRAELPYGDAE